MEPPTSLPQELGSDVQPAVGTTHAPDVWAAEDQSDASDSSLGRDSPRRNVNTAWPVGAPGHPRPSATPEEEVGRGQLAAAVQRMEQAEAAAEAAISERAELAAQNLRLDRGLRRVVGLVGPRAWVGAALHTAALGAEVPHSNLRLCCRTSRLSVACMRQ